MVSDFLLSMRSSWFLCLSCLAVPLVGWSQPGSTTRAQERWQDLLEVQQELLTRAAAAEVQEDVETLRPRLQTLVFDWEGYLRDYPDRPAGLIAYSMLLGNPLVDERKRAKALLLRANDLDPDQPIVKNQLGKYLAEEGLPRQALPYFLAAIELAPNEPLYHYQVGQLLGAARKDFLTSGEWTVETIDTTMQTAFREAVRLDPASLPFAYRLAESYYDLQSPPWDEALAAWQTLEERVESPVEKQMMRLHQANVLLFQGNLERAEAMLAESGDDALVGQRQSLRDRLVRLRDPPAPTVAVARASAEEAAPLSGPPGLEVPEFQPVDAAIPVSLSSRGVVELHQSSTLGEVGGWWWPDEPVPADSTARTAPPAEPAAED